MGACVRRIGVGVDDNGVLSGLCSSDPWVCVGVDDNGSCGLYSYDWGIGIGVNDDRCVGGWSNSWTVSRYEWCTLGNLTADIIGITFISALGWKWWISVASG